MSDLAVGFQALPIAYQQAIQFAQDQHHITITPLQTVVGGRSGASVFLVSVAFQDSERIEHFVLKLERKNAKVKDDAIRRLDAAARQSPPGFATQHLAQLAFERIETGEILGAFYSLAGQSLHEYRTVAAYDKQSQVEAILAYSYQCLLNDWNVARTFTRMPHPTDVLKQWLSFRLKPGSHIERFIETVCRVPPDIAGFLIQGAVFPNPLAYARTPDWWEPARPLDVAVGLQHGDVNTNNLLVKFDQQSEAIEGYYLIDFAFFQEHMPLVFDLRHLEMSYLILRQSQLSFAKLADLIVRFGEADTLDPQQVPIDVAGLCATINSTRREYARWITEHHPSLRDDLWGQFWLAGVAVGLGYCYKAGMSDEQRMSGLIYAAANLKRYAARFNLPLPTTAELLYDERQFGAQKPMNTLHQAARGRPLPSGVVTFLFTDIEGSTRLAQQHADSMPALLARHHEILDQVITQRNGFTFEVTGDSFAVAFADASDALKAALDIQRALREEAWGLAPITVRIGIHTGRAQAQETSRFQRYAGHTTLATTQRIMAAGHGGQILVSQTVADLTLDQLPPGVRLVDMRERRLKGLEQPVHVYQLTAPDLPAEFAPLTAPDAVNHNLPTHLTGFIGRETELASLQALLSDERVRLITIVAPGGMGKTRLGVEAAAQTRQAFPQGVYLIALDRISAADRIEQAVAEVLPISLSSKDEPKARILDYLRDKAVLLVMDNCEHVLEGAAFIQQILEAAPRVRVLATSRVRLNLLSETIVAIEGLTVDEANPEQSSALQLFAQSAKRVHPAFELNDASLPAVTHICRLVDGMPLAIVLAAAWSETLAPDEIAAEIAQSIDVLETELRDVPDRQRSVRAVIESSWQQIAPSAQTLLKYLSVYRGGFTRAAAQAAAGATLRDLSQLGDRALVRRDPHTGRYSIHELLRQYAEEQLMRSDDLGRSAHEAHGKYFADFIGVCGEQVHDHRQRAALHAVEADMDNIRVAWGYWADRRDAPRLLTFLDAMWVYFEVRGSFTPAIQFFDDAAKKLTSTDPDIVCAQAQLRARQAWFTALIGLADDGLQMAQDSISALLSYSSSEDITVETYHAININAIFLNQHHLVDEVSQRMLARAQRSGVIWEHAWALIWRAYALVWKQRIGEAVAAGQEALAIFETLNNPFGASVATGIILGTISMAMGDISAAKAYFMRGVGAAEEIGYLRLLQICYDNLGAVALLESDPEQARAFFRQSLRISQECGQTREQLASLRDFANVYIAQGDLESALQLLAIVLSHPASEQNSLNRPERLREEADKLRAQIMPQLDQPRYQAAWEAGQRKRLAEAVAQMLV